MKKNSDKDRKKAESLLARMSLDEKIRQMAGHGGLHSALPFTYTLAPYPTPDNKRLKISGLIFTDGPRGINLGKSTCFPVAIARGATWDPELETRVGHAMGLEARSRGANALGAVCVNVVRHPSWGRSQETFGADPCHIGVMGAALTTGLAQNVMPVIKHFACNSIENSRFKVNVQVDERTLREIYLPHFKKCIDAGAACVMTAYNRVNGNFCGQNNHLINHILKGEWAFDGFVMSDFLLGCRNTAMSLNAGLDMEMPQRFFYSKVAIKRSMAEGKISLDTINKAVARILLQKVRFGLTGEGEVKTGRGPKIHPALALEAARKSMVLLKNQDRALPLERGKIKSIAVIGKLAGLANMGAIGSTQVNPPYSVSPLEGLKNKAMGIEIRHCPWKGGRFKKALDLAHRADAAIVFAGLTRYDEGEYFPFICGGDRKSLELPRNQEDLILSVAKVAKKVIVVLQGGGAIACGAWIDHVDGLIMAWYPGMEGGNAIAEVLLGDVNPSGKLPLSFPVSTDQLPEFDCKARQATYDYWHDYRYFDHMGVQPLFPFGFGLSYTRFTYSDLRIEQDRIGPEVKIAVSFDVTNTGKQAGEETAQIYVGFKNSSIDPRSHKELKGFGKCLLQPGETKTLNVEIQGKDLGYYCEADRSWKVEQMVYSVYVGASARDIHLTGSFRII
ncbi:MAG: glycoside hydrolase family 3 C-terminal domain-containing protein [Desulfatibacillum sp.]|nr:glycoside hydrolase family 3 C-terminal domain-containing protein [Desulfatibacillum sp.]